MAAGITVEAVVRVVIHGEPHEMSVKDAERLYEQLGEQLGKQTSAWPWPQQPWAVPMRPGVSPEPIPEPYRIWCRAPDTAPLPTPTIEAGGGRTQ